MGQVISEWNSKGWKPKGSDYYKYYRSILNYNDTTSKTELSVVANAQSNCKRVNASFSGGLVATERTSYTGSGKTNFTKNIMTLTLVPDKTYYWERKEEPYDVVVSSNVSSTTGAWTGQVMTASKTFTVEQLDRINITYNGNDASATDVPEGQIKYYGKSLTLTSETPVKIGSAFTGWNTESDGSGTTYLAGQEFTLEPTLATENLTLYAQWTWMYQPECTVGEAKDTSDFISPTKNFSTISVDLTNVHTTTTGREPVKCYLKVGTNTSSAVNPDALGKATVSVTPTTSGTLPVSVILIDTIDGQDGARQEYPLDPISVSIPTWTQNVTMDTNLPDIGVDGKAPLALKIYNYTDSKFDLVTERVDVTGDNGDWSFKITLDEDHVSNTSSQNPTTQIKATFNHTETHEKDYRAAFYGTTRNANFSTGLANTMFISGCSSVNFSSRVWWSYVNNPLYFPDLNYVEVGSNDTSVQGLIKVGDYLGAIKQSKTTDTAIYLLYPTSFDDETTYAVKQGVQGVGALAKYSFNILGDETLFLSPNGVMAIVPSEDEEHKVQNRSYFVDGKLLKENDIKNSYSFVYDGMYWLCVGDHCYVLDGNQKNSYGNDKTSLVYEAYYLENIPASCFMKYNDELWFSNDEYVCRFTDDSFADDENGVLTPVKAEWSTILDDDGSLHYYKTMNKKGNCVSVFPKASEHTEVLIRKDNEEPVLINRTFNETSTIPSELYVNKKFKKYKRLQFIVRNEKAENFGVDSIVKSYSLGNYAKR